MNVCESGEGWGGESREGGLKASTLPPCRFASYEVTKKPPKKTYYLHTDSVVSRRSPGLQLGELRVYGVPLFGNESFS